MIITPKNRLFTIAAAVAAISVVSASSFAAPAKSKAPAARPAAKVVAKAPAKPALDGAWTVDAAHTSVNFSIKHMSISTVHGRFADVSGAIVANSKDLAKSSVQFTIKTDSISTDQAQRDAHLKSADFFDVATYPTITFQSTKIVKTDAGYTAIGNLTMHGVTKVIRLPFTIEGPAEFPAGTLRFGLAASTTIKRSDYGVGSTKFTAVLGDDVPVDISLEATQTKK
ncbi:MAG TPA: YceI family protein [Capsulimonadaceae bacterium]|jgi:polyisoprenoid-binding protein YceI